MLGRCLAFASCLVCAGLLAQPCAASPFQWASTDDLNTWHDTHTATSLPDGKVLVAAGFGYNGWVAEAELYDPTTGNWTFTGSLITYRSWHSATLLETGTVLVVG